MNRTRNQKSYSQYGQDLLVQKFFAVHPPVNRFFVDAGAFDGQTHSNSRLLFESGWSGICIEPETTAFESLQELYRGTDVTCCRVAASDFSGEAALHVPRIDDQSEGLLASIADKSKWRFQIDQWSQERVAVTTIEELLDSFGKEPSFVTIDVEGEDLPALRGINLRRYKPDLIVIEHARRSDRLLMKREAKEFGYRLWLDNGTDLFLALHVGWQLWPTSLFYLVRGLIRPIRDVIRLRSRLRSWTRERHDT